ncbi:MAG: tyrosine-type recombinase/integrase [Tepidisphaeraceae bacterium]
MTPAQLGDLISVCGQRRTYYLFAYYTGIRVKAAKAATWGDVDFDGAMIRVKVGNAKGKIEDVYHPIHPALLRELIAIKPMDAKGADKIFTHVPTVVTFHRDCKRAGIPRFDEEGRQLDRHALRTTLGTHLAQYGVLPQQAMKVLGHSDVRITMKHYTALRISDTAKAVQSLPTIQATVAVETVAAVATGTDPACHHICHHPCSTSGQSLASSVTMAPSTIAGNVQMQAHDFTRNCRENVATFPSMASSVLPDSASPDTIAKTRAISSVG